MDFYTALDYLDENEGAAITNANGMTLSRRVPDVDDGDGLGERVCLCELVNGHWLRTMPSGSMFRDGWEKVEESSKK